MAAFAALGLAALLYRLVQNLSRWPLTVALRHIAALPNCTAARTVGLAPAYRASRAIIRSTMATATESPANPGSADSARCRTDFIGRERIRRLGRLRRPSTGAAGTDSHDRMDLANNQVPAKG
jgi:hypothetical protein